MKRDQNTSYGSVKKLKNQNDVTQEILVYRYLIIKRYYYETYRKIGLINFP